MPKKTVKITKGFSRLFCTETATNFLHSWQIDKKLRLEFNGNNERNKKSTKKLQFSIEKCTEVMYDESREDICNLT